MQKSGLAGALSPREEYRDNCAPSTVRDFEEGPRRPSPPRGVISASMSSSTAAAVCARLGRPLYQRPRVRWTGIDRRLWWAAQAGFEQVVSLPPRDGGVPETTREVVIGGQIVRRAASREQHLGYCQRAPGRRGAHLL